MLPLLPPLALVSALPPWAWAVFFAFITAMLALDLGVFQREAHEMKLGEALAWCAVWLTLALAFNAGLWWWRGAQAGQEFLAAYLVELCLSVDNVFVFILVFAYFKVAPRYQHRVLFWGIIGAVLMRGAFILVGVNVLARFHWVLYLFGAFIVYSGVKMALPHHRDSAVDPENNFAVRLFRKYFPVGPVFDGGKFFTRDAGRRVATPLLIVLIIVETTDLMFALDSIPAVLAITASSFVALTSNIFAILGLRALYFALSGVMQLFRFLRFGLAAVLVFIGAKMLVEPWVKISITTSLAVIGCVLTAAVVISILIKQPESKPAR